MFLFDKKLKYLTHFFTSMTELIIIVLLVLFDRSNFENCCSRTFCRPDAPNQLQQSTLKVISRAEKPGPKLKGHYRETTGASKDGRGRKCETMEERHEMWSLV